jgi:hypothetical protein
VHVTGQHGLLLARLAGDRAGPGVVLAGSGVAVAGDVVTELGKHPGAEHDAQAELAEVDLSVRVLAKMRLDLLLHSLDFGVEAGQDRYLGPHGGRVRAGDHG